MQAKQPEPLPSNDVRDSNSQEADVLATDLEANDSDDGWIPIIYLDDANSQEADILTTDLKANDLVRVAVRLVDGYCA